MASQWLTLCVFSFVNYMNALVLSPVPPQPILGDAFKLICTTTIASVVFYDGSFPVCFIHGPTNNGSCSSHSCNKPFHFACNTTTYTMTIPGSYNIDEYHGHTWTCKDWMDIKNPPSNKVTLNVIVPLSSVSLSPNSTAIIVGNDQNFTCKTNAGRPNARIQWYLSNGTNLTTSALQQPDCRPKCNKSESTSVLMYTGNLADNEKFIYCVASNMDGISVRSQNVTISFIYGPSSVELSPSTPSYSVTEITGHVGPINCTADCNPTCTILWNGPNLPGSIMSVLHLHSINRNQAGGYQCTANNSIGSLMSGNVSVEVFYGPSFVQLIPSVKSYTVNETTGRVGPINCTADCRPTCTMTWNGPNLPGGTTSVLHLLNVSRDQAGDYRCTANNSVNNNLSERVKVEVNYGPTSIILSPATLSYTVTENKSSIGPITCTADCRPNCRMTWSGPNLPRGTSELHLQNINRNQAGDYRCTASNSVSNLSSKKVAVVVNYGPENVTLFPSSPSYTVTEISDSVGPIDCTADCRPNCTFTWSGPNLPDGTTSVLNLRNITRSQAGDYQCKATNNVSSLMSGLVAVIVNYGPSSVFLSPSNVSYTVTETVGSVGPITCTAECRPNCTMTWSGPYLPSVITYALNLMNITRKQAGNYLCTARNTIGNKTSVSVAVNVYYSPTIQKISGSKIYNESDTAEFRCQVDSSPKSTINWKFKNGKNEMVLLNENKSNVYVNDSVLTVLQMHCLSMGQYMCEAKNSIGKANKTMNVTVMCAPRLNTIEYKIIDTIAVKDNEPLNITAPILAYPAPWMYWQFILNNSVSNVTDGVENVHNLNRHISYLFINNMTQNNFGKYEIYARNGIEESKKYVGSYFVLSARRPNKPSNITCSAGYNYIVVNWQSEFNGGSPQHFIVFYKHFLDEQFKDHPDNVSEINYHPVRIEQLRSSSMYLLKVHTTNIFNTTVSDEIKCNTTAKGIIESKSLVVVGVGAGVGSAAFIITSVLTGLLIFRRLRTKPSKHDKEPMRRSYEENEKDGLEDNPLYVSSNDIALTQNAIYNQVPKVKKQKKTNKIEMDCVYENHDNFMIGDSQIYSNQIDTEERTKEYFPTKNKDGLIYADLDLVPVLEERRFIIRGIDNRNNYAVVDFSKKADPLPSDEEDDKKENK